MAVTRLAVLLPGFILLGALPAMSTQLPATEATGGLIHTTSLPLFFGMMPGKLRGKHVVTTPGTLRAIARGLLLSGERHHRVTCIDVGAHEGFTGKALLEGGCTHLSVVEPGPSQFKQLKTRLEAMRRTRPESRVVYYHSAVSSERGEAGYWDFPGRTPMNALTSQDWHSLSAEQETHKIKVETILLSDVIPRSQGGIVNFMKVDIQGHELHAVAPFKQYLSAGSIHFILFEFWPKGIKAAGYAGDASPEKLLGFLQECGFELHLGTDPITAGGTTHRAFSQFGRDMATKEFVQRLEDVVDQNGVGAWVDILAIHRSPKRDPFSSEELEALLSPSP